MALFPRAISGLLHPRFGYDGQIWGSPDDNQIYPQGTYFNPLELGSFAPLFIVGKLPRMHSQDLPAFGPLHREGYMLTLRRV